MDMELLSWLDTYAFPEEAKYADMDYARKAYAMFVHDLKYSPTTRCCVFATIHTPATLNLMQQMDAAGLYGYVGKVNMDRNSPDYYIEADAKQSLADTEKWLAEAAEQNLHVKPILTPRFTPSCTDALMAGLGNLSKNSSLPVQSHLSENLSEMDWVKELCPWADHYIETYKKPGLIDKEHPSVMAHCVYSDDKELRLMKENNVFLAHCPQCNMNIASGVAQVRKWLDMGLSVGLGTDVAGGASLSIFRTMMEAMQVSKLVWRLMDQNLKPLTLEEIFYLGTKGGGAFFGKVGSFEKGYAFDALVLDETNLPHPQPLTVRQRLERFIYLSENGAISHKYIAGHRLF
jgi:guanine deaminase